MREEELYNLIKHLCAFYLQTKSNVGFIENTVKQNFILPRYLSHLWMFNKYLWISQDISYYLRISFFLRTKSTFGFSWMQSTIQDTWHDKCCSLDVQVLINMLGYSIVLLVHLGCILASKTLGMTNVACSTFKVLMNMLGYSRVSHNIWGYFRIS